MIQRNKKKKIHYSKSSIKKGKSKKVKFPSELRSDLANNDWVVIATDRAKKPEMFKKEKRVIKKSSQRKCPFCNIQSQKDPTLIFSHGKRFDFNGWKNTPKNWTTIVIPNKYPAFLPSQELNIREEGGLYQKMNAVGFHEVVVTRDHNKHMGQFSIEEMKEVFDVYQARYLDLMDKNFVNHIFIFHNHGASAGASITHPHSQIITTPLVDSDLQDALTRSKNYLKKNKKCLYCQMNELEKKMKKRVIFENKEFMVVCPFASKTAFQLIVSPKKHLPYFERITEEEKWELAEAFQVALNGLYRGLNNPDYNFYLHTAPSDGKNYDHYHWHWTILPKTAIWAGFEIEARMEISTIEPEKAAEYLRSIIKT